MVTSGNTESKKSEPVLEINSFDKPKELSGVNAWSQMMTNLLFLKPGSYPSIPEMGIGIEDYQYEFTDTAISELSAKITTQQQKYLPDIPLSDVQIIKTEHQGQPILLIQLIFNDDSGPVSSAIALNTSKRNFLDFEVSW